MKNFSNKGAVLTQAAHGEFLQKPRAPCVLLLMRLRRSACSGDCGCVDTPGRPSREAVL